MSPQTVSLRFWACAMTDPQKPGFFDIVFVHLLTDAQIEEVEVAMTQERERRGMKVRTP